MTSHRRRTRHHNPPRTGASRTPLRPLATRLLLAIALVVVFGGAIGVPRTAAHARLLASDPAPGATLVVAPATMRLTFSEAIDPAFSSAALVDASGATVSAATIAHDPATPTVATFTIAQPEQPAGAYVLVWRVLSAIDGHVTTGALAFSAGTGAPPSLRSTTAASAATWPTTIARWADLVGAMLLAGALLFVALVTGPLVPASPLATAARRWLRRVALASLLVGGIGLTTSALDTAIRATDRSWGTLPGPGIWWDVLASATSGQAMLARALLLPATALLALAWARRGGQALAIGGTLAGIGLLATFSFSGHAAAGSDAASAVATDLVHLVAAAGWTGGLAMLALITLALLPLLREGAIAVALARVAHRFSYLALGAMGIVIASGLLASAARVSGPRNLTSESYGLTLIVKTLLVLLVLIVAGTNLLFIVPRLRRGAASGDLAVAFGQAARLRLSAGIELGLAVAILICAVRLTVIAPADGPLVVDVAPRHLVVAQTSDAGDLRVALGGAIGDDPGGAATLTVTGATTGAAAREVARVIVLATAPDPTGVTAGGLRDRFDAAPSGTEAGVWTFPLGRLGFQAAWTLEVTVRRAGVADAVTIFALDLAGTGAQPPLLVADAWRLPALTLSSWALLVSAIVTVGGGLVLVRRLPGLEPATGGIFLLMIVLIAGGFALSAWRFSPTPTSRSGLRNPLDAADAAVVAQGDAIWAARCASCHGVDGRGPDEAAIVSAHGHRSGPYDLTDAASQRPTDGDLFAFITEGVPGSEMPAYGMALNDEERWALVIWLRQLQREAELNPEP